MPKQRVKKAGAFVDIGAASGMDVVAGGVSTSPATYVGSTTGSGGAGSVTLNVPAGVQAGDLMLMNFELQDSSDAINVPAGWTALYDAESGAATSWKELVGCWKVAGASEPASYTVTIPNTGHGFGGAMTVYRNAGTPVLVGTAIDGAAFPAATVTTGTLVIGLAGNNTGTGPTAGAGFTERVRMSGGYNLLLEEKAATVDGAITPTATANATIAAVATVTIPPAPGSHTLTVGNANQAVEMDNPAAATVTIPTDASAAIPVGSTVIVRRRNGVLTIAAQSGVTYNGPTSIVAQYDEVLLHKRAANSWHGSYLSGADIASQLELDAVVATLAAIGQNNQTADYSLVLADAGKVIELNKATAINLTIPLNASVAFPIGTVIELWQQGAGQVNVVPTGGVTLRSPGGLTHLYGQYSGATLRKRAADEWVLQGDLA